MSLAEPRPAAAVPPADAGFDVQRYGHSTTVFGMWIFLLTELMLFGGLFAVYWTYRYGYGAAFREASAHLPAALGAVNTAVLIGSSLMVALAGQAAQQGRRGPAVACVALTMLLGVAFLVIKGFEYADHFRAGLVPGAGFQWTGTPALARGAELFYSLYYTLTGLHAVHMLVGLGIMAVVLVGAWRRRYLGESYTAVELAGLYWHFVDVVWVFLFPLLYLVGRHGVGG